MKGIGGTAKWVLGPWLGVMLASSTALAQTLPTTAAPTVDVNAAARAFAEGQRYQLARDHARAAEMFELADDSAPSPAALRSAIRSHQAAGHSARAATLALRAQSRDASDPQSAQLATAVLAELSPRLGRLRVQCEPECGLTVDNLAAGTRADHAMMLDPGAHMVSASWGAGRARSRSVTLTAGQASELLLEAPPPPAEAIPVPVAPTPPPVPATVTVTPPPIIDRPAPDTRPLPPAVFFVGLGLTVASGALLLWSGLDTLEARDAYVAQPTESAYNNGVSLETRTNIFAVTTGVLGAATIVTGLFFTRWGRARDTRAAWAPAVGAQSVGVVGSF